MANEELKMKKMDQLDSLVNGMLGYHQRGMNKDFEETYERVKDKLEELRSLLNVDNDSQPLNRF